MTGKFFQSLVCISESLAQFDVLNNKRSLSSAFDETKRISDTIGFLIRLIFLLGFAVWCMRASRVSGGGIDGVALSISAIFFSACAFLFASRLVGLMLRFSLEGCSRLFHSEIGKLGKSIIAIVVISLVAALCVSTYVAANSFARNSIHDPPNVAVIQG